MKKVFFLSGILSILIFASCKKSGKDKEEEGVPAENSFTIDGQVYKMTSTSIVSETSVNGSGILNSMGFGVNVGFYKALPTTGGTFKIVNSLKKADEILVNVALNGGTQRYTYTDTDTQTGTVTINSQGKINIKLSNVRLASTTGTALISVNISQP